MPQSKSKQLKAIDSITNDFYSRRVSKCILPLFILFFLSPPALADLPETLMPLPNHKYTWKCDNNFSLTTNYGRLEIAKIPGQNKKSKSFVPSSEFRMNYAMPSTTGLERGTFEVWGRFTMIYNAWEKGNVLSVAKLSSGNLRNIQMIVGNKYEGQISQTTTSPQKIQNIDWKVEVHIKSAQKITFKEQTYIAYKINVRRTKINMDRATDISEFIYAPQLHAFYSMKINSGSKKPLTCELENFEPIKKSSTSSPEINKSEPKR